MIPAEIASSAVLLAYPSLDNIKNTGFSIRLVDTDGGKFLVGVYVFSVYQHGS